MSADSSIRTTVTFAAVAVAASTLAQPLPYTLGNATTPVDKVRPAGHAEHTMTVTEQMLETRVKLAEVGMEAKVAGLGGRIDTLAAAVSGIKDRVDDLATRFTNIPADIAGMKSEISNLPTKDWVTKQFDRQLTRFSGVVAIIGILIGAAFHFIGH